jgi:hypothetical protein
VTGDLSVASGSAEEEGVMTDLHVHDCVKPIPALFLSKMTRRSECYELD